MGLKLGDAVLWLTANDSELKNKLKGSEKEIQGWGSKVMGVVGKGVAIGAGVAAAAGGAMVAVLVDAAKAAAEAETIQAQLNAVLKSTGGVAGMTAQSVNDLAESLSMVTPFEDDAIVAGENLLLTFTNIGKDVFPAATETMLDMSQALGQDMKSSAVQLGKALNDPILGITALSRVGVSFTEEQKEQIRVLQESGDIMGAQQIILGELQREFGGAAQAAGSTFSGQLTILNNQLGNVKEEIGAALLPVLTQLIQEYGPGLVEFAKQAADWIVTSLIPAIQDLAAWLKTNIPVAIAWAVKAFEDINKTIDAVRKVFDDISAAISNVVGWIDSMIEKFKAIQLPSWLTPGSPTPLELGLRGIAAAMADISQMQLPRLAGGFQAAGAGAGNYQITLNISAGGDGYAIGRASEQGVLSALRSLGVTGGL